MDRGVLGALATAGYAGAQTLLPLCGLHRTTDRMGFDVLAMVELVGAQNQLLLQVSGDHRDLKLQDMQVPRLRRCCAGVS